MAYSYLAPLIFPVLPSRCGLTYIDLPIGSLVDDAGLGLDCGDLKFSLSQYEHGVLAAEPEVLEVQVRRGQPNLKLLSRRIEQPELGYFVLGVESKKPFFRKITTEIVNSMVERPDGSVFNISANSKFAEPPVIKQIQATRKFCIVHTGNYVSAAENAGNSTLIINPFDGPLVAKLTSETGAELKRRVMPSESLMISLQDLLPEGEWSGVMYTGSNRFPAWDIRHDLDNPDHIHHVDHLEYYRGEETRSELTLMQFAKEAFRDALRVTGLRDG